MLVQRLGITSIRLTGGEPTVRADLDHLIRELAPLGADLSMTTNGAVAGGVALPSCTTPACVG
ncbi:MAG: hypothetical protein V9E94_14650 [Microthrixaceae bacterium]